MDATQLAHVAKRAGMGSSLLEDFMNEMRREVLNPPATAEKNPQRSASWKPEELFPNPPAQILAETTNPKRTPAVKKWKHEYFEVPSGMSWICYANNLGEKGWELVQVLNSDHSNTPTLIMKREVPDPLEPPTAHFCAVCAARIPGETHQSSPASSTQPTDEEWKSFNH
jgi:hypothetical protein